VGDWGRNVQETEKPGVCNYKLGKVQKSCSELDVDVSSHLRRSRDLAEAARKGPKAIVSTDQGRRVQRRRRLPPRKLCVKN